MKRSAPMPPGEALKVIRGRARLGAGAHGVGDPFETSDTVPPKRDGAWDGIRSSIDGQGNVLGPPCRLALSWLSC